MTDVKSIVLAEDHRLLREGLKALLQADEKLRVVGEAENGLEALKCVEKHRPNLILLDLSMPKMSGLSVIKEIKSRFFRNQNPRSDHPRIRPVCSGGFPVRGRRILPQRRQQGRAADRNPQRSFRQDVHQPRHLRIRHGGLPGRQEDPENLHGLGPASHSAKRRSSSSSGKATATRRSPIF